MARSQLTAQARRRHTFLLPILSDVLPLESLLVLLSSLSINGNSTPYIRSFKSGSVSGFLVLSHTFQNVQSCISNRSVPQITVSVVRQMAHNMHIAYIASCIHVKLKIATMLYHCWLYAVPRTCNYNIQWVHDTRTDLCSSLSDILQSSVHRILQYIRTAVYWSYSWRFYLRSVGKQEEAEDDNWQYSR